MSKNLLPEGGKLFLYENFLTADEAHDLFHHLQCQIQWKHEPIQLFGKSILQPRLTAFVGDPGKPYHYSGIVMTPQAWTDLLITAKTKIEKFSDMNFTSALLNLYRNERDSVGWHSDNEKELGADPTIASVSLGATRIFKLKHRKKKINISIQLHAGSLLIMKGATQRNWSHCILKQTAPVEPRINITFRKVMSRD